MSKTVLTSFTILCLLSTVFLMGYDISVKASPDIIYVPDDYPTIQEAVNAATSGDIIYVRAGIYYENVVINKNVLIVGESHETTIIDGNASGTVVFINASGVLLSNFTIRNSGFEWPSCGIKIEHADNCNLTNNLITSNFCGICLSNSSNNLISMNNMVKSYHGIWLSFQLIIV